MPIHKMVLSTTEPNNNVPLIRVIQDDKNSQIFEAEIIEEGKLLKFEEKIVFFNARIGPYKVRDKVEQIYYDSSRIIYTLIDPFLQKIGEFEAWFSFADGDYPEADLFSTMPFRYRVLPGIRKNIWEGNYFWDLEELVQYYERYKYLIAGIVENKDFSGLIDKLAEIDGRTTQIDNFKTASKIDAEEGIAANKFMTPQRVTQQTDARLSTSSEAIDAMDDKKLMTPQKTALLISESRIPTTQMSGRKEMFLVYNSDADPTMVLERMGDWVFLMIRWTSPTSVTAGQVIDIANLPDGFKTFNSLNVGLTAQYDATGNATYCRVQSGNIIQLKIVEGGSHGYSINGLFRTGDFFPDDAGDITPALYHLNALEEFKNGINQSKFNIGFVTDSHYDEYTYRDKYSKFALKKLNNILSIQSSFDMIHSNGDNCDSDHADHDELLKYYKRFCDRWFRETKTPKFMVNGNHDDGSLGFAWSHNNEYLPTDKIITQEEFATLFRGTQRLFGETRSSTKQDYVYDIPKDDYTLRVIGLDSLVRSSILDENGHIKYPAQDAYGYSFDQLKFVYEALKSADEKTHIAILMHVPVTDYLDGNGINVNVDSFIQLISAFVRKETLTIVGTNADFPFSMEVDFTNAAGEFIATFTGHTHSEHLRLIDDTWYSVCHARAMHSEGDSLTGTVKEDCFYCIEIDPSTKTVNVKGYGRGTASRKFTY